MVRARSSNLLWRITIILIICWLGMVAEAQYGGGTGSYNDPYLIYDANQMNAIGTNPHHWDSCFKLMADIDLSVGDIIKCCG